MNTIEIAVHAQDSHDYLTSSDHKHLSLSPVAGRTHNYHEPIYSKDTGCIDLTTEDSRIIGHILAPAGTVVYKSAYDEDCIKVGGCTYLLHEAVSCAKEGIDGMVWRRA